MEIEKEILMWEGSRSPNVFTVFMHLAINAVEYRVSIPLRRLAEETGLNFMTVKRVLDKLEADGIIVRCVTNNVTEITICRYVTYGKKKKPTVTKNVTKEIDLVSFVAPEHLDAWKQWLEYKAEECRSLYTTTAGAKREYNAGVKRCSVTVTDYNGMQTVVITPESFSLAIEYSMHRHWDGIYPQPSNYGRNSNNYNNTGRTTQQDAERIAAQHITQAAQSSISAEENRRRIEAELGLLG